MNDQQRRNGIFNKVWQACDTFRGVIDPAQYKDYILTMLFVKYLSDIHKSRVADYEKKYEGDSVRIQRALGRERFIVPEIKIQDSAGNIEEKFPATFDSLFERRTRTNIGELINILLEHLEDANKGKLHNVFRNIDFNSEANLGQARQRNTRLKNQLEDLADIDFFRNLIQTQRFVWDLGLVSPGGAGRNRVLNQKDFLKIKVVVPSLEKQKEVGKVLSTTDQELHLLEDHFNALEKQKRGLMQKLLTGEVRVAV